MLTRNGTYNNREQIRTLFEPKFEIMVGVVHISSSPLRLLVNLLFLSLALEVVACARALNYRRRVGYQVRNQEVKQ